MEIFSRESPSLGASLPTVERATLGEQVARAIRSFIVDSRLKPGDKLPSERELCAHFQVSRMVTREALRSLATAGVVEIQHGRGTYVKPFDGSHVAEQLAFGLSDEALLFAQMLELRFIIEAGAIELAVIRANQDDLSGLGEILGKMRSRAEQGHPPEELDLAFHTGILRMANNAPLARLSSVLNEFFRLRNLNLPPSTMFHTPDELVHEHEMLLDAIRQRNAAEAKRILRDGLLEYEPQAKEWRERTRSPNSG